MSEDKIRNRRPARRNRGRPPPNWPSMTASPNWRPNSPTPSRRSCTRTPRRRTSAVVRKRKPADSRAYADDRRSRATCCRSPTTYRAWAKSAIPEDLRGDDRLKGLIVGLEATKRELDAIFQRNGITRIAAMGLPLDPNQHQAMLESAERCGARHDRAGNAGGLHAARPACCGRRWWVWRRRRSRTNLSEPSHLST